MSTGTLNGQAITQADIVIPSTGVWHAVVRTGTAMPVPTLPGAATLVIGGLSLVGTVLFGEPFQGEASYRLVGGAGGWRRTVPARSYQADIGVKLSSVLADAARDAGETVVLAAGLDRVLGASFVRAAGPAGAVLRQLVDSWWVDVAGVTQVGPRPPGDVASHFQVVSMAQDRASATIASEKPEDIVPGRTITVGLAAPLRIGTVVHQLGKSLRTEVWGAS